MKQLATLALLLGTLSFAGPASAQERVRLHQDGSSVRAEIVQATGAAIRSAEGRRIRFSPTRVATQGDLALLFAAPVEAENRRLCYLEDEDFWMGESGIRALFLRVAGNWEPVMLEVNCDQTVEEHNRWVWFLTPDFAGDPR